MPELNYRFTLEDEISEKLGDMDALINATTERLDGMESSLEALQTTLNEFSWESFLNDMEKAYTKMEELGALPLPAIGNASGGVWQPTGGNDQYAPNTFQKFADERSIFEEELESFNVLDYLGDYSGTVSDIMSVASSIGSFFGDTGETVGGIIGAVVSAGAILYDTLSGAEAGTGWPERDLAIPKEILDRGDVALTQTWYELMEATSQEDVQRAENARKTIDQGLDATPAMYGDALAYEEVLYQQKSASTDWSYGRKLAGLEIELGEAGAAGDSDRHAMLYAQAVALQEKWDSAKTDEETAYNESVAGILERMTEQYSPELEDTREILQRNLERLEEMRGYEGNIGDIDEGHKRIADGLHTDGVIDSATMEGEKEKVFRGNYGNETEDLRETIEAHIAQTWEELENMDYLDFPDLFTEIVEAVGAEDFEEIATRAANSGEGYADIWQEILDTFYTQFPTEELHNVIEETMSYIPTPEATYSYNTATETDGATLSSFATPLSYNSGYVTGEEFVGGLNTSLLDWSEVPAETAATMGNATQNAVDMVISYDEAYDIGRRLPEGMAAGIAAREVAVEEAARRLARAALIASRMELLINSPSRAYAELGMSAGEGFALGMVRSYEMVEEAARNMVMIEDLEWARGLDLPTLSEGDMRLLVDLAGKETVNKYTEIKIEMGGVTNQMNSKVDVDWVMKEMGRKLMEQIQSSAHGLHM